MHVLCYLWQPSESGLPQAPLQNNPYKRVTVYDAFISDNNLYKSITNLFYCRWWQAALPQFWNHPPWWSWQLHPAFLSSEVSVFSYTPVCPKRQREKGTRFAFLEFPVMNVNAFARETIGKEYIKSNLHAKYNKLDQQVMWLWELNICVCVNEGEEKVFWCQHLTKDETLLMKSSFNTSQFTPHTHLYFFMGTSIRFCLCIQHSFKQAQRLTSVNKYKQKLHAAVTNVFKSQHCSMSQ